MSDLWRLRVAPHRGGCWNAQEVSASAGSPLSAPRISASGAAFCSPCITLRPSWFLCPRQLQRRTSVVLRLSLLHSHCRARRSRDAVGPHGRDMRIAPVRAWRWFSWMVSWAVYRWAVQLFFSQCGGPHRRSNGARQRTAMYPLVEASLTSLIIGRGNLVQVSTLLLAIPSTSS